MTPFGRGGDSGSGGERTEADRERARLEREARRAAREDKAPPPPPPAPEEVAPDPDPAVAPEWIAPLEPGASEEPVSPEELAQPLEPAAPEGAPLDPATPLETWDAAPPEAAALPPEAGASPPETWDATAPPPEAATLSEPPPAAPPEPAAPAAGEEDASLPATSREWSAAAGEPDPDPPLVRRVPQGSEPTVDPPLTDPFIGATGPPAPPRRIPDPPAAYTPGERPIGTRRVGRPHLRRGEGATPPPAPPGRGDGPPPSSGGADDGPRPPRLTRAKRRRRPVRLIGLVLGIAVIVAALWFVNALFQPFHGKASSTTVSVRVPKGATTSQVGDLLANRGVVSSSFFFSLRARVAGKRDSLKAGTFRLARGMSYAAALDALGKNPPPPPVVRVTIPEGPSRREVAPLVKKAGIKGNYGDASVKSPALNPRSYGAPAATKTLEGFLFPATYELKPSQTVRTLVSDQVNAFKQNIATISLKKAKSKHLSTYDVVTIASMIEREAAVPKDRRLISAVIYNRLKDGMTLGIDATLRYALHDWTHPLKVSQLNSDSPYNTGKHLGLPPTPIGNPGLASLQAAADPANVSYLFYVVKPCGKGAHAFSSTDAKFQRDVAAYNKARAKAGGKSPVDC